MDRFPDPGSPLEDAGIPDLQDVTAAQRLAGDDQQEIDVTHDRALVSESWGTTAAEQRAGEPLDLRLAHEEPEVGDGLALADADTNAAGRLVEDDEGAGPDEQKDAVARSVGNDGGGLTAEEAAMHVIDEPTAGA
jgi:hypothetical protein